MPGAGGRREHQGEAGSGDGRKGRGGGRVSWGGGLSSYMRPQVIAF